MPILGDTLAVVSLILSLGRGWMGKAAISARPSRACDLTFTDRDMYNGQRQWSLRMQVVPKKLVIKNGDGYQYEFMGKLKRSGIGTLDFQDQGKNPGEKHKDRTGQVVLWHEPFPAQYVSDQTSDIEVEIWVRMGDIRRRLYKGVPTSIHIEREL